MCNSIFRDGWKMCGMDACEEDENEAVVRFVAYDEGRKKDT